MSKASKSSKRTIRSACEALAEGLRTKFAAIAPGGEEDLLRRHTDEFLEAVGQFHGYSVVARDESPLDDRGGRPDFAVVVDRLLCGYIELKAPGTGADPARFKGHNQRQWQKFQHLPNLVYTDGNSWSLIRNGQTQRRAQFAEDLTVVGEKGVDNRSSRELEALLLDFFRWKPIVPKSAKQLAAQLAPLCRMLRDDVMEALAKQSDAMLTVARDWRRYLFPEASDEVLADSYAQTVVFALLLARSDGSDTLLLDQAIKQLTSANTLLSRALEVLTDPQLSNDIGASVALLQRVISAVPTGTMSHGRRDPWLHFYEDFLAEYDPKLRKDAGAYYTPVEVVQAQVRLVDELLRTKFGKPLGFADGDVATLDPAVGTGTYLLGIVEHAMQAVQREEGKGAVKGRAESLVKQIYGFEIMVGPYSVAALRLTRMIHDFGARVPRQGVGICLTNTLESPHEKIPELPLLYRPIGDEHKRARSIKDLQPVLVCIGNPPYDRHEAADASNRMMTGAWVRWGEAKDGHDAILGDFIAPVRSAGKGGQLKNLYNLYVYFWRWALWKVFEHQHPGVRPGPGIVTYISASSYIDGDAFLGMREHLRRVCDEVWIIDVGGEGRGTRQDENVFNIQTPVAIAIAVRYGTPNPSNPAMVHYCRLEGSRDSKLHTLENLEGFDGLSFEDCPTEWGAPFRPRSSTTDFSQWPQIKDVYPWQTSGSQIKRTWPVGTTREILQQRWNELLTTTDRAAAFKESRDRTVMSLVKDIRRPERLTPIADIAAHTPVPEIVPYGFRSFDRQWLIADNRLADYLRPALWRSHSASQIYFASLLYSPLGAGPALTVSSDVPDLHYFSGRGAKDIVPLYRDAECQHPNIHPDLIPLLSNALREHVSAEDVAAYIYAVLANPSYTARFKSELENREVRIPITLDRRRYAEACSIGRRLLYLHTYAQRFARGQSPIVGRARCTQAVSASNLPETFRYEDEKQTLYVGDGQFKPVSSSVWEFEVSGLKVLQSWLAYRMKVRKGRKSSPLDDISPDAWPSEFTSELIRLLHVLEETLATYPKQEAMLDAILDGELLNAQQLGDVPSAYRTSPNDDEAQQQLDI